MNEDELTYFESILFKSLPAPPEIIYLKSTNVWVIEWLSPNERSTGYELHEWLNVKRPRWSNYYKCENKAQVLQAISKATVYAGKSHAVPVLHIEAHGSVDGLAPDSSGHSEFMLWEELTIPLQQLNLATRCNLVVFIAACIGFAGIKAFHSGPRAPAVALVGPVDLINPRQLLEGSKEFYRRWMDDKPKLIDIVESASRDSGAIGFEYESFVLLAFEAVVEEFIKSLRPNKKVKTIEKYRQKFTRDGLSKLVIEIKLALFPYLHQQEVLQQVWDQMFMIDLYPENKQRFGVNMKEIVNIILKSR